MFAVPGWSLSSKKIVQEQPKSTKDRAKQSPAVQNADQAEKKRKRTDRDDGRDRKRIKQQFKSGHEATTTAPQDSQGEGRDKVKKRKTDHSSQTRTDSTNHSHKNGRPSKTEHDASPPAAKAGPVKLVPLEAPSTAVKLTPLQAKMRAKLTSARFRHLNETLYTTDSASAMTLFTSSPELFAEYHAGFSQQVKDSWPQNPVDTYVKAVKMRSPLTHPKGSLQPLPRRKTGSCTIADLGCGDAPLARNLKSTTKKFGLRVHSYDLHAPNEFVTKADMTDLPLRDGEADVAIFCLSLMGTNWLSFVEEAWRILRGDGKGEVWVAEVKSRFGRGGGKKAPGTVVENSVGKRRKQQKTKDEEGDAGADDRFAEDVRDESKTDETDVSAFVNVFQRRGFVLREETVDKSNKMFVSMVFVKSGIPTAGKHKGMKWNGNEYQKMEDRGSNKRFANGQGRGEREEVDEKEEAKVLKPCVYKTR